MALAYDRIQFSFAKMNVLFSFIYFLPQFKKIKLPWIESIDLLPKFKMASKLITHVDIPQPLLGIYGEYPVQLNILSDFYLFSYTLTSGSVIFMWKRLVSVLKFPTTEPREFPWMWHIENEMSPSIKEPIRINRCHSWPDCIKKWMQ